MNNLSIIQPTGGHGDLLSPRGHRHIGHIDADNIGVRDAFTEHGSEVHELVFQQDAGDALLAWEQVLFNSIPIFSSEEIELEDSETLAAREIEWGASMLMPPHSYKH